MAKVITLSIAAPKDLVKGETFEVEVTLPAAEKHPRGQLAGIELADMTDEQLKREIINANSVLYKAKQREAAVETITANQTRVDAAIAEKTKRQGAKAVATPNLDAATADKDGVDESVAAEV